MARSRKDDVRSKGERQQAILRLVREYPISRQEVLLDYLSKEGFEVTQATVSRDIRELCLVKAATAEGYRYVSSRTESFNISSAHHGHESSLAPPSSPKEKHRAFPLPQDRKSVV